MLIENIVLHQQAIENENRKKEKKRMIKAKFEKESYAIKGARAKVEADIEMKGTFGVVRDELIEGIIKMIRAFFREKNFKKSSCMEFVRFLIDVLEEEFLKEEGKNKKRTGKEKG